ncbi:MBL fold metallo-hydrolase [Lachnospiraceae bacterium NSJ-143]|nr:MBL fold metallo-hydrolase [Lachnospiraceae bacterium NSJ-143]
MDKKSYEIKMVSKGIWAVNEYQMDYMYIVEGAERSLVIDTGTGTGNFKSVVESITDKPYDVVCTHNHVDHCGGIGQFEKIYIHGADIPALTKGNGLDGTISVFNRRRYSARGFAVNPEGSLPFTLDSFEPVDTSGIKFAEISEGFVFDLGGRSLEVFEMPGHSLGCICLLDRENRILFAGDSISKILILPLDMPDRERIGMWLGGAEKILSLRPFYDTIYTGHICPAPVELFLDQIELARRAINGSLKEEFLQADEFKGMLYHYGQAYFTLREENLKTRDYRRILNPEKY